MTPQERDVIAGIFDRLKQAATQPRDPEAEKLIAERLAQQPYATYAMAQAIYVQEQALLTMQSQVEQLQAQVKELQDQPPAQPSGGFLSGLFGGAPPARPAAPPHQPMQRPMMGQPNAQPGMGQPAMGQGGPWGGQQPAQQAGPWGGAQPQRGGSGFMGTALAAAAGVAGGMMLGNAMSGAFGAKPPAGDQAAAAPAADAAAGNDQAQVDHGQADQGNEEMQPASYEDPGMFDDGGGDEWA